MNRPLVLVLWTAVAAALGTPARAADAPAADASPEDPKVKATAFALPHPDVDEATMVEVMRAIEGGLRRNPRLEMKDLDTRLADFAQETPNDQIDAARSALREGRQAATAQRLPEALQKLDRAVTGLAAVLPYIKKQELADAQAQLAVARYQSGDRKGGRDLFVELLTWRGDYAYDPAALPPEFLGEFEEARGQVEKSRRMAIAIQSDPPGAQAYVDGKYIGITPCTADGQPVGKHYVTFKREGYRKAVTPVLVRRGDATTSVRLERSEKYLLVEQARAKVEGSLGNDQIDAEADNLKAVLFVEHAVFVRAARRGGSLEVDAWLYDLRTRKRLSHVHQSVKGGNVAEQLAPLADNLYLNVSYEGELIAPVEAPPPPSNVRPAYKSWWLWTAVGAGLVVAGGAIGTYYGVKATSDPSCPVDRASCFNFQP